jgi:hypothetical protein
MVTSRHCPRSWGPYVYLGPDWHIPREGEDAIVERMTSSHESAAHQGPQQDLLQQGTRHSVAVSAGQTDEAETSKTQRSRPGGDGSQEPPLESQREQALQGRSSTVVLKPRDAEEKICMAGPVQSDDPRTSRVRTPGNRYNFEVQWPSKQNFEEDTIPASISRFELPQHASPDRRGWS